MPKTKKTTPIPSKSANSQQSWTHWNMFVFSRILFLWVEQNIGFVFEMLSDFSNLENVEKSVLTPYL